jgi:hypothetical protein
VDLTPVNIQVDVVVGQHQGEALCDAAQAKQGLLLAERFGSLVFPIGRKNWGWIHGWGVVLERVHHCMKTRTSQ